MPTEEHVLPDTALDVATPACHDEEEYELVYYKPHTMVDVSMHYCPGCAHSLVHKLIMEVVEEMDIQEQTIGIAPVGCSVFAYDYMDIDMQEAAHGRACAVATGIKRLMPDKYVFTYQGDGDLAAIGIAETLHAINRGENILIVFMNNAVYGMTSGQMAPTTLEGQITSSSPRGRDAVTQGRPFHITEMLAIAPGVAYAVRRSVHSPGEIRKTKKAIQQAFEAQLRHLGLSIVEVLGACPTNWRMDAVHSLEHVRDHVAAVYPLGDFKVSAGLA